MFPQFVNSAPGFDQEEDKNILETLVKIFKKLDIDLEEDEFQVPFESYPQELTNKVPVKLKTMRRPEEEEILPVKKF